MGNLFMFINEIEKSYCVNKFNLKLNNVRDLGLSFFCIQASKNIH